jgi:alanyl-tRNA synthetase
MYCDYSAWFHQNDEVTRFDFSHFSKFLTKKAKVENIVNDKIVKISRWTKTERSNRRSHKMGATATFAVKSTAILCGLSLSTLTFG